MLASLLTVLYTRDFQLMMVYLSVCALIFVSIATVKPKGSMAFRKTIFKRNEQTYLADHVVETKLAYSEIECGLHCGAEKSCTSVNFKISGKDS